MKNKKIKQIMRRVWRRFPFHLPFLIFFKNLKENIQELANSQETFNSKSGENQMKTIIKKIMVIGEKSCGKKSFINSFFNRMQKIKGNDSPMKYE